jgi:hypothetical protein
MRSGSVDCAFYVALAPELEPYVLVMHGPRAQASLRQERLHPSSWQLALTTAGMVALCFQRKRPTPPEGHEHR